MSILKKVKEFFFDTSMHIRYWWYELAAKVSMLLLKVAVKVACRYHYNSTVILNAIVGTLSHYEKHSDGYPHEFKTWEEWMFELKTCREGFEAQLSDAFDKAYEELKLDESKELPSEFNDVEKRYQEEMDKNLEASFDFLKKYIRHVW